MCSMYILIHLIIHCVSIYSGASQCEGHFHDLLSFTYCHEKQNQLKHNGIILLMYFMC